MKVYFKYTSEFGNKYINFESLLQVYAWVRKEIQMHFKNRFKVYMKYTSVLNSWCMQSILETYKSRLFLNYIYKVTNFESQNILYLRVQKFIWGIAQLQQNKVLIEVYIIYRTMA